MKSTPEPLVTVVIPAYNRARSIENSLRSVQAQTYQNWEVIVVDDSSKDDTAACVMRLGQEDSRIKLIRHQRNQGAQAARNTGIHAAQGKWIAFLDSDDQFFPYSLESRMMVANRENVSVVHSGCNMIHPDGSIEPYRTEPISGRVYRRLLEREGPVFPGILVSREAMQRIGYLDERIEGFQEWDTAIRLAKHYPFGFEPRPTFIYDCRNSDTLSKNLLRGARGYEQVVRKHYWAMFRHVGPRALARHYDIAAGWYERGGDQRSVRRCQSMGFAWLLLDPGTVFQKLWRLSPFRGRTNEDS